MALRLPQLETERLVIREFVDDDLADVHLILDKEIALEDPLADLIDGVAGHQARWQPELGLYWALSPTHRGKGYATEAARALVDHAFAVLNPRRVVANTDDGNQPSQAVMGRLGMTLHHNDGSGPQWFEVLAHALSM